MSSLLCVLAYGTEYFCAKFVLVIHFKNKNLFRFVHIESTIIAIIAIRSDRNTTCSNMPFKAINFAVHIANSKISIEAEAKKTQSTKLIAKYRIAIYRLNKINVCSTLCIKIDFMCVHFFRSLITIFV